MSGMEDKIHTMASMFPTLSRTRLTELLDACSGNLEAAINMQLNSLSSRDEPLRAADSIVHESENPQTDVALARQLAEDEQLAQQLQAQEMSNAGPAQGGIANALNQGTFRDIRQSLPSLSTMQQTLPSLSTVQTQLNLAYGQLQYYSRMAYRNIVSAYEGYFDPPAQRGEGGGRPVSRDFVSEGAGGRVMRSSNSVTRGGDAYGSSMRTGRFYDEIEPSSSGGSPVAGAARRRSAAPPAEVTESEKDK